MPIAVAVAAVLTLGAVTALAVAPRGEADLLPRAATVIEPIALDPGLAAPESLDRFLQAERVRRGDSLASLMARLGALDLPFQHFVAADPVARKVLALEPGRTVLAELDASGTVLRFSYRLDGLQDADNGTVRPGRRVLIQRDHRGRLMAREEIASIERDAEVRSVEIRSNVFAAADAAGIPDAVLTQIDDLFGHEIDLQRDLRPGDRLKVVWETVREAGSFDTPAAGRVLAVELDTGRSRREAYWFVRGNGKGRGEYYAADGRSLRKSFLRSPIEASRVMSGFSDARLHPVMRDWRAHKGVDFSAPLGTRVRTVGDGVVEFAGQQRGYGNVVIVRHAARTTTLYAHLDAFANSLNRGDTVSQGDVIGTVGQTGWATGPHLHFEFLIDGNQRDPMTVALQQASPPMDAADRRRFADALTLRRGDLARADLARVAPTTLARFQ